MARMSPSSRARYRTHDERPRLGMIAAGAAPAEAARAKGGLPLRGPAVHQRAKRTPRPCWMAMPRAVRLDGHVRASAGSVADETAQLLGAQASGPGRTSSTAGMAAAATQNRRRSACTSRQNSTPGQVADRRAFVDQRHFAEEVARRRVSQMRLALRILVDDFNLAVRDDVEAVMPSEPCSTMRSPGE